MSMITQLYNVPWVPDIMGEGNPYTCKKLTREISHDGNLNTWGVYQDMNHVHGVLLMVWNQGPLPHDYQDPLGNIKVQVIIFT